MLLSAQILLTVVAIATTLIALVCGVIIGLTHARLSARFRLLEKELKQLRADEETPAIIETTPQIIREKIRKGETPGDDSAIVTTKTPQELRQAQDAKLKEDLDRLSS